MPCCRTEKPHSIEVLVKGEERKEGSSSLSVFQPPRIQVQKGGSVSLSCLFSISHKGSAIDFTTWYNDVATLDREVNNKTLVFRGRLVFSDQAQFLWDQMVELQIRDIRIYNAGLYLCKMDVLGLGIGTGEGTKLVVKEGSPWPKVFLLFLPTALYIFSLAFVVIGTTLYKRQMSNDINGSPLPEYSVTSFSVLKMRCDTWNFTSEN
ncbi:natural cytotoxicity triggering receptor 3 [Macrotis lagotis]|uniref:natural cytotoxicity triggering receptor 3 n=1 Tax=Macrotis lagotis TaxID=92651 RepID=UPI003D68AF5F